MPRKRASRTKYQLDPPEDFQVRLTASDGIPEYNALLDKNLGSRRGYLLGRKKSLKLLRATGCVSLTKNTNQELLKNIKKRNGNWQVEITKEPPSISKLDAHYQLKQRTTIHRAAREANETRQARIKPTISHEKIVRKKLIPRPQTAGTLSFILTPKATLSVIAKEDPKKAVVKKASTDLDTLLQNDNTFQSKIDVLKEECTALDKSINHTHRRINYLRKQIKGVNAVDENDAAIAHVRFIIQRRLAKAEEEYMKAVTHRESMRLAVNDVRRELLSIEAVKLKLLHENENAAKVITSTDVRIKRQSNIVTSIKKEIQRVTAEAEVDTVAQWHKMPGDDKNESELNVPEIMRQMQERATRRATSIFDSREQQDLQYSKTQASITTSVKERSNTKIKKQISMYNDAFMAIQTHLGFNSIEEFVEKFTITENELLSLHMHNNDIALEREKYITLLQEEMEAFEGKQSKSDSVAHVQHTTKLVTTLLELQENVASVKQRQVQLKEDHDALRPMLIHFLEVLKDSMPYNPSTSSNTSIATLGLDALLAGVQIQITKVAIAHQQVGEASAMAKLPLGPKSGSSRSKLHIVPPSADAVLSALSAAGLDLSHPQTSALSMPSDTYAANLILHNNDRSKTPELANTVI